MVLLIRGKSKCSLCETVLARDEAVVGFAAFLSQGHPLWRYSDSAMHPRCFEVWEHREEFEALYSAARIAAAAASTPEAIAQGRRAAAAATAIRIREDAAHNETHAKIMVLVRERGAACPHCSVRSVSYRELAGTARLRLACLACRRSCNASELHLGPSEST